jgi:hypothetical protein
VDTGRSLSLAEAGGRHDGGTARESIIRAAGISSHRARLAFACVVLVAVVAALAIAAFQLGFLDGGAVFWRYPKGDCASIS